MKKNCLICGKEFSIKPSAIKRGRGKFCSNGCREISYGRTNKECLECRERFKITLSRKQQKFCSTKCHGKWCRENRILENHPNWKGGKLSLKCLLCKKDFQIKPSQLKYGAGKFCSKKCQCDSKSTQVVKTCSICGELFKRKMCFIKKNGGKFCSMRCYFSSTGRTSIEIKVKKYLDSLGIRYEEQKVIPEGRTVADFYIPEQRIVLYADGHYWHSLPGAKDKDCKQDFRLGMNGYKVLRLPEDEINNGKFSKRIKQCLQA